MLKRQLWCIIFVKFRRKEPFENRKPGFINGLAISSSVRSELGNMAALKQPQLFKFSSKFKISLCKGYTTISFQIHWIISVKNFDPRGAPADICTQK